MNNPAASSRVLNPRFEIKKDFLILIIIFFACFDKFLKELETLDLLIDNISSDNIKRYKKLSKEWNNIVIAHSVIQNYIYDFKSLLFKIIKGHMLENVKPIEDIISNYNYRYNPRIVYENNGSIQLNMRKICEKDFIINTSDDFSLDCNLPSLYSYVSYFSIFNNKKIKHCPYCEFFYLAKDIKKKKCYSVNC